MGMFYASAAVVMLFLYLPGALVLRALRVSRVASAVLAPVAALAAYSVLCVVYGQLGVFTTWAALVLPVLAAGIVLYAGSFFIGRARSGAGVVRSALDVPPLGGVRAPRGFDWLCLALYVAVGLAVTAYVFVGSLNGADSFVQEFDNIHHLGVTAGFIQSGNWSSLHSTLYATAADAAINPLPGTSFYPAAWNCAAALAVSALGVPVTVAANAVNFLFIAVVFPSNAFLLMRLVLRDKPGVVAAGALTTLAFTAFPWAFLVYGPLYPNMIAFAMLPSVVFCFIKAIEHGASRTARVLAAALFCVGVVCLAFSQPNAVFSAGVLLAPYLVYQVGLAADRLAVPAGRRRALKVGLCALAVIAVAAVWMALYRAPFLQGVVTHDWPAFTGKYQAFVDVLTLAFRISGTQMLLALLVGAGIVYTLYRRRYLWMTCSFALVCFMYIIDVSSNGPDRFILTGFWYTDSCRVGAMAGIFAIPLASIGLWQGARGLRWLMERVPHEAKPRTIARIAPCVVAGAFLLANFYPSFIMPGGSAVATGFGSATTSLGIMYDFFLPRTYDAHETAFVEKVKQTLPEGALVLNEPDDGSAFAYSVNGLNVYYRYLRTYGEEDETLDSRIIRTNLDQIATSEQVREAVRDIGAEYLLLLDVGVPPEQRPHLFTYENGRLWGGLEAIDDDTPGFEVVLRENDMRLYRIVDAD